MNYVNGNDRSRTEIPPGTLEMLILRSLSRDVTMHGYGVAKHIRQVSDHVLCVEEGSLYPALQRILNKGWVSAEWGRTECNRRARFYRLTQAGRKQMDIEVSEFARVMQAIARVLQPAEG